MSDTLVGMLINPALQLKLLFGVSSGAVCAHVIITDKSDDDLLREVSWLKYVCPLEAWMPELTKANMLQLVTELPVLTTVEMHMTPVVDHRHSETKPAKVFKGAVRIPGSMLAMLWSYMNKGNMPPWVSNGKHDLATSVHEYVGSVVVIPDTFIGGGHLIHAIASGRQEECDRVWNQYKDHYSYLDSFQSQETKYMIIKDVAGRVMKTLQGTQEPVSVNDVLGMLLALHSHAVPTEHLIVLEKGLTDAISVRAGKIIPANDPTYSSKNYAVRMVQKNGLQVLSDVAVFDMILFMLDGKLPDDWLAAPRDRFLEEWKKFDEMMARTHVANEQAYVRDVTKIIRGWVKQFMTTMQCANHPTLLPVITGNFTVDKGCLVRMQALNPSTSPPAEWKMGMFWQGFQLLQLVIIAEPCGDLGLRTRYFSQGNWNEIVAGLVGVPAAGAKRDSTGSIPPDSLPLTQFEPEFRQWLLQAIVTVVRARGCNRLVPGLKLNDGLTVSRERQLIPKLVAQGLNLPEKATHRILDLAPPVPAPPGSSGPGAGAAPAPTGAAAGPSGAGPSGAGPSGAAPVPTGAAAGPGAGMAPNPMPAAVVPNPGAVWDGTDASLRALGWHTIEKFKDLDALLKEAILIVREGLHKSFLMDDDGNLLHIAFNGDADTVSPPTIVRFLASEIKGWVGQLYFEQPLSLKHMLKLGVGIHPSFDWRNQNVPKYITNQPKGIKSTDSKTKFKSFMATKLQALYDHDSNLNCFRKADPDWRDFFLKDEAYYNDVYRDGK